jgi:hypothetical protein
MENARFKSLLGFIGRVTVVHVVTYSVLGILAAFVVPGGHTIYSMPEMAIYFRPISSPYVMAGTLFQLVRGPVIAVGIFPFRQVFLQGKWGWLYLWGLFLTLAILAPAGAAPGSIEGYVYTKLPVWFHLAYLPEIALQTLAFSGLVFFWERSRDKRIAIPLVAVFAIIVVIFLITLLTGSLTASS